LRGVARLRELEARHTEYARYQVASTASLSTARRCERASCCLEHAVAQGEENLRETEERYKCKSAIITQLIDAQVICPMHACGTRMPKRTSRYLAPLSSVRSAISPVKSDRSRKGSGVFFGSRTETLQRSSRTSSTQKDSRPPLSSVTLCRALIANAVLRRALPHLRVTE